MQAEGIRAGDRSVMYDDNGRVISGWTATGDAVVEGNDVYIPVAYLDGGDGTRIFTKGTQVPLAWGAGESWTHTHARENPGHEATEGIDDPGSCKTCPERSPVWELKQP